MVTNNAIDNTVGANDPGLTNTMLIQNTSNTASSQAQCLMTLGGTSAGDTWSQWTIGSTRSYSQGIDNSASQVMTFTTAASATVNPSTATPVWTFTPGTGFNYEDGGVNSLGIGLGTNPTATFPLIAQKSQSAETSFRLDNPSTNNQAFASIQASSRDGGAGVPSVEIAVGPIGANNLGSLGTHVDNRGCVSVNAATLNGMDFYNVTVTPSPFRWFSGSLGSETQYAQLDTNGFSVNTVRALTTNGNLTINGNGTGNVISGGSRSGADNLFTVQNTSNTASSQSGILTTVAGSSAGDAYHQFTVTGVTTWTIGVDNSASDAFVIAPSTALGTSNAMSISTSGDVTFTNPLGVPSGGTGRATLTNHGVLVGAGAAAITQLAAGTAGQVLQSGGASSDPAYSTATYPNTAGTSGNVLTSDGTNFLSQAPASGGSKATYSVSTTSVSTPADATLYFISQSQAFTTTTDSASGKFVSPVSGTINKVFGKIFVTGTLGTGETSTLNIKKNGTTDTAVTTTLVYSAATNSFSNTALGISVTAGDYFQFVTTTPTWATNPTNVGFIISLVVE